MKFLNVILFGDLLFLNFGSGNLSKCDGEMQTVYQKAQVRPLKESEAYNEYLRLD